MRFKQSVPIDSRRRKPPMSSPKAKLAIVAKKKALKPNPDKGKDVAVPRLPGQLNVASLSQPYKWMSIDF